MSLWHHNIASFNSTHMPIFTFKMLLSILNVGRTLPNISCVSDGEQNPQSLFPKFEFIKRYKNVPDRHKTQAQYRIEKNLGNLARPLNMVGYKVYMVPNKYLIDKQIEVLSYRWWRTTFLYKTQWWVVLASSIINLRAEWKSASKGLSVVAEACLLILSSLSWTQIQKLQQFQFYFCILKKQTNKKQNIFCNNVFII